MTDGESITRREQLRALVRVAQYRLKLVIAIIFGGVFAALLEGVGLGFIMPIVEIVQFPGDSAAEVDGVMELFVLTYDFLGIPLTLGFVVTGVSVVLAVR
jgi:subfamily B ATP-binding cassette protein MsbA